MIDSKVVPKFIPTNLKGSSERVSIDRNVIDMLRALELPENVGDFSEALSIYSEKLAFSIKEVNKFLMEKDLINLEKAAQMLSQNALRIGAVQILRSAYELQSVARLSDLHEAEIIVQSLQLEYLKVRQDLEKVT